MTPIEQSMAAQHLCMSENGFMAENVVYVLEMKTSLAMKQLTRAEMVEALPATSRHTRLLLRLLPSGPDRIHRLVLRENRQGLH
ncbi:hypothetical protein IV99_08950 [Pectobacterium brasiliense]|nr:hypothetical protein IV99_08950 [Pectobacterium brasiliense]